MLKVIFLIPAMIFGCVSLSKHQNLQNMYNTTQSKYENDRNKYEHRLERLERSVAAKNNTIEKLQNIKLKLPEKENTKAQEVRYTLKKICVLFEEDIGSNKNKNKSEQACYDIVVRVSDLEEEEEK